MSGIAKHRVRQPDTSKRAVIEPAVLPGDPPAYEEIAALAYSYWDARGCQGGSPVEDWLRAEEEIRKRHARLRAPKESGAAAKGVSV